MQLLVAFTLDLSFKPTNGAGNRGPCVNQASWHCLVDTGNVQIVTLHVTSLPLVAVRTSLYGLVHYQTTRVNLCKTGT